MKTVSSLEELSVEELVKIRSLLHQRFGIGTRGNIIDVAFGLAEENGRIDRSRPDAVCFYVRHKRMPRAKADRIPESIELRLKRGRGFVQVRLATDVIHIGTRQARPSGERIVHQQSTGPATTGGVVAWRLSGQAAWTWGVLTVGHVFKRVATVPETDPRVWIGSSAGRRISGTLIAGSNSLNLPRVGRPAAGRIRGTLISRSKPLNRQNVDAALVMVERASLVQANLIPANVSTTGKRIRPVSVLKDDRGKLGFTFPEQVTIKLKVVRFLPISEMVPALGTLNYVIEADAAAGVFGRGRSGSSWAVERQAACMQHGGLPGQYARGWGQALEFVFGWCVREIAAIHDLPADAVELRLIRMI
jgi:hypothetical protein